MSTSDSTGLTLHFIADGLTIHTRPGAWGEASVMRRGQTLLVTPEIREANTDRLGNCAFDLSEEEQQQRFAGRVFFRPGPFPEDEDPLTPDSPEWDERRVAALRDAANIADPDQQRITLAKIRERYGVPASGRSRTIATYKPR